MDEFLLPIDANKFRSTNQAWNSLRLNDPWSVGYVTSLIVTEEFRNKEEWEHFYYKSGEKRAVELLQLNTNDQTLLEDEQLVARDSSKVKQFPWNLKQLNFQFGRTAEQLRRKGQLLYEAEKNNGFGLTVEECFQCVRFRVICETWNGVILRENNTVSTLKRLFPQADFRKTEGEFDHQYAVDYEVFKKGTLVYGLQIKPESYTRDAPYINKARFSNQQKNLAYTSLYGVPVYDIISGSNGAIINQDILKSLGV